jgi:prolyl-tRNA synthetase
VTVLSMTRLFHRTLREDPADADVRSHQLLVRAGYIRRAAPGIYSWLPLGWRVLRRVEAIVREEMEAAGAQEVHLPALLPREPYDATGRWTDYGDNLFRLQDRRGTDMLLGPTHEEMFTLLAKEVLTSYKDLPITLFQIQTKYRDEARPRAGILRGREFSMKDAYSFDLDDAGLAASYAAQRVAYVRTFDRLGLEYVPVHAVSGAMGGSASEEFLAPMEAGEDAFVQCTSCDYAANTEAVTAPTPAPEADADAPPAEVVDTPDTPTIESLVHHLNAHRPRTDGRSWRSDDTLKNILVVVTRPDGSTEPLAIGLPGDRELDMRRLAAQVEPATARPFAAEDFAAHPTLVKGYIGPGSLGGDRGVRYLLDPRIADGTAWVSGADRDGHHTVGLVVGRDIHADGTIDVGEVRDGDPCPRCGDALAVRRGVEIGHIFQLGPRYAAALGLQVQGPDGRPVTPTMGSYGIGTSRAVAAIAETTSDELGLCWPRALAPADVHLVAAGRGADDDIATTARRLADDLSVAGLTVLLDDRTDASAGVKFKDAELIGIPTIVVVGRGLTDGVVELRDRAAGERRDVGVDDAVSEIVRTSSLPPSS